MHQYTNILELLKKSLTENNLEQNEKKNRQLFQY